MGFIRLRTDKTWEDHLLFGAIMDGWMDALQATRILAQLMVAGATVVFRAATQAWGQALASEWSM